ncbi:L-lactate dehydrogenase (cytochrome) [Fusarium odoratissimum NRRL 54006]|uniref:L-lactate dehydrogenase (cytochrome) n=2 Tax=Fusarium odoratissimum (strain NRRL 54006) TaxID=1089451 RepID=X0J901_FUSO5|nr:L-lactate dehydrogenase (cytochrome) [Fusarium odoratissimum NRRL 54006]EXL92811.1 L-lactate dehydrogenase (cytochrome) [Fusarium odoratissimum NRRL 54006]
MVLHPAEVAQHNNANSCWLIIHNKVYDLTDFLPNHPGGKKVILKNAGKDSTADFDLIHSNDVLDKWLEPSKHLGDIDTSVAGMSANGTTQSKEPEQSKPKLSQCVNISDFESVAQQTMKKSSWNYYSTGAEDEFTIKENNAAFQRIRFRPKVLINVEHVDISTTMLGAHTSAPIYITATAHAKLGDPDGEVTLARASNKHDIIQMIPLYSSCPLYDITNAREPNRTQWYQIYVKKDRNVTRKAVEAAEARGCKALCITVDNPHLGSREKVLRSQQSESEEDEFEDAPATELDPSLIMNSTLSWDDIPWFQEITNMSIVLKGVQRVEDVIKAVEYGVQAVIISNHGGRQLDYSEAPIEVLAEVMPILRERGLQGKIEVYIDGGVRRGSDVLKALCLGARGVGIGRPFLYAMAAYGQKGLEKAIRIYKDELERNMRLLGCTSIGQLHPGLVKVLGEVRERL